MSCLKKQIRYFNPNMNIYLVKKLLFHRFQFLLFQKGKELSVCSIKTSNSCLVLESGPACFTFLHHFTFFTTFYILKLLSIFPSLCEHVKCFTWISSMLFLTTIQYIYYPHMTAGDLRLRGSILLKAVWRVHGRGEVRSKTRGTPGFSRLSQTAVLVPRLHHMSLYRKKFLTAQS